jgi:hypothetical protein
VRQSSALRSAPCTAVIRIGRSSATPAATWTNAPPVKRASLRATNASWSVTIVPRWRSTSSACSAAARSSEVTVTPAGRSSGTATVEASTCVRTIAFSIP